MAYNVLAYGAKGDGVTNDTASINAALAAVSAAGGGRVYFPSGTYLYSFGISALSSNLILEGVGTSTVLRRTNNVAIVGTGLTGVRIINMQFDGNSKSFDMVDLVNCSQCVIQNCTLKNGDTSSAAITLQDGSNANTIRDCYITNCGVGINLLATSSAVTNNQIVNNVLSANGSVAGPQIWLRGAQGASNNIVDGNVVVGNATGYGIVLAVATPTNYNRISNNYCASNGISGILCNADRNLIVNNHCISNGLDGIDAGDSSFCTYEGNWCFGNSGHGIEVNAQDNASTNNTLIGNNCQQNAKGGGNYDGIRIQSIGGFRCQNHLVIGNSCIDDGSPQKQVYGIRETNGGSSQTDQNWIVGNYCSSNLTGGVLTAGPNSYGRANTPATNETIITSGSAQTLALQDTGSNGANLRLQGSGGVTPAKSIRAINGAFQVLNDAYSAVILALSDAGTLQVPAQMYPGDETATARQTSGGFLHSTGIPSNANGSNNDWCISDNGHLYFKAAGAWSAKI